MALRVLPNKLLSKSLPTRKPKSIFGKTPRFPCRKIVTSVRTMISLPFLLVVRTDTSSSTWTSMTIRFRSMAPVKCVGKKGDGIGDDDDDDDDDVCMDRR